MVHCKSKDNDLGFDLLHYEDEYGFHFRANMFRTTLFFCSFQWEGGLLYYLDVYKAIKKWHDWNIWDIKPGGPCNMKDSPETCHAWKNKACIKNH